MAGESQTQPVFFEQWRDALAAGIRLGPADAPVQVVEFADFQCPYCARFELTVKTVREKYPDQVAFTFAHMPLPQHGFAESAARAAECADSQGRFEAMRVALHVNPDKTPCQDGRLFCPAASVNRCWLIDLRCARAAAIRRARSFRTSCGCPRCQIAGVM